MEDYLNTGLEQGTPQDGSQTPQQDPPSNELPRIQEAFNNFAETGMFKDDYTVDMFQQWLNEDFDSNTKELYKRGVEGGVFSEDYASRYDVESFRSWLAEDPNVIPDEVMGEAPEEETNKLKEQRKKLDEDYERDLDTAAESISVPGQFDIPFITKGITKTFARFVDSYDAYRKGWVKDQVIGGKINPEDYSSKDWAEAFFGDDHLESARKAAETHSEESYAAEATEEVTKKGEDGETVTEKLVDLPKLLDNSSRRVSGNQLVLSLSAPEFGESGKINYETLMNLRSLDDITVPGSDQTYADAMREEGFTDIQIKEALLDAKNQMAGSELIMKNTYQKMYNTYGESLKLRRNFLENLVKEDLGTSTWNTFKEYLQFSSEVDKGEASFEDLDEAQLNSFREALSAVQSHEASGQLMKVNERMSDLFDEYDVLPSRFKKAFLVEQMHEEIQKSVDDKDRSIGRFYKLMNSADNFANGLIHRTSDDVTSLSSSVVGFFGRESSQAALEFEAATQETSTPPGGFSPSRRNRALHHYAYNYADKETGEMLELAFDDSGELIGIYDDSGNNADISDEKFTKIRDEAIENDYYSDTELVRNADAFFKQGLDLAGDVAAMVLFSKGSLATTKLVSQTASAAKLGRAAKLANAAHKSDRFNNMMGVTAQYTGRSSIEAIRSGNLDGRDAVSYGVISSLLEGAISAAYPMASKIARGKILNKINSLDKKQVLDYFKNINSQNSQAMMAAASSFVKGIGSEILEEGVAEGFKQRVVNSAYNRFADGQFEDDGAPTVQEMVDIGALSAFASFAPSMVHAMQTGKYKASNRAMADMMLSMADPKYTEALQTYTEEMVAQGKITQEEADAFNTQMGKLSGRAKEIREKQKHLDTPERKNLKEELLALEQEKSILEEKETHSDKEAEKKSKRIEKLNEKIEAASTLVDSNKYKRAEPKNVAKKNRKAKEKVGKKESIKKRRSLKNNFKNNEAATVVFPDGKEEVGTVKKDKETGEFVFENQDGKKYTQEELEGADASMRNSEGKITRLNVDDLDVETEGKIASIKEKYERERKKEITELAREEAAKGKNEVEVQRTIDKSGINEKYDKLIEEEVDAAVAESEQSRQDESKVAEGEELFENEQEAEEKGRVIRNKDGKTTTTENKTKGKTKTYKVGNRTYTNDKGTDAIVTDENGNVIGVAVNRKYALDDSKVAFLQGEAAQIMAEKILKEELKESSKEAKKEVDEKTKKAEEEAARKEKSSDTDGRTEKSKKINNIVGKKTKKKSNKSPSKEARKKNLEIQIRKIKKAFEKFLPDVKIHVAANPKSFADYMQRKFGKTYELGADGTIGVAGAFAKNKEQGKVIVINLEEIKSNTLYHEGSHAVLDLIKEIEPEIIDRLYDELLDIALNNSDINKYLDYGKQAKSKEEAVVEFLADFIDGRVSPSDIGITMNEASSVLQRIKDAINKAIKSFTGEAKEITDVDLKALAIHLKESFLEGKSIADQTVEQTTTDGTEVSEQVTTMEGDSGALLSSLYGKEKGRVTNTIMQRVINNVAKRMNLTYDKMKERLSIVKGNLNPYEFTNTLVRGLSNDLFEDFTGADRVSVKFQGNPISDVTEVPKSFLDKVEGMNSKSKDDILLYKAAELFPDIMQKVAGSGPVEVDLRREINLKQGEIAALYKAGRGAEASTLKEDIKQLKKDLKNKESGPTTTKAELESMLIDKMNQLKNEVNNTDNYIITEMSDEFIESHLETAKKREDQAQIDAWEAVRDNPRARQQQIDHQQQVQRDIFNRSIEYLIDNNEYPVGFQVLAINEVLNRTAKNIYETTEDGEIVRDEDGNKVIKEVGLYSRTNTTYGEPMLINSANASAVYNDLVNDVDLSIAEIILKNKDVSFLTKGEIKEIAYEYIHEYRSDGVWIKIPRDGTKADVENLMFLTRDSHRTGGDWCTGSISGAMAQQHNSEGDFYIFFDKNWNARLAAKFTDSKMGEPMRGLLKGQEVEPSMNEESEYFMDNNPGAKEYKDNLIFNQLWNKYKGGKKLELEDVEDLLRVRLKGDGSYNSGRNARKKSDLRDVIADNKDVIAEHFNTTEDKVHAGDLRISESTPYEGQVVVIGSITVTGRSGGININDLKYVGNSVEILPQDVTIGSLENIGGSLRIHQTANLPSLKSVAQNVDLYGGASLVQENKKEINYEKGSDLRSLKSIGEHIFISSKKPNLSSLEYVGSNLNITADNDTVGIKLSLDSLKSVGNSVNINRDFVSLKSLESIGSRGLTIKGNNIDLSSLKEVEGRVSIDEGSADLSSLKNIGEILDIGPLAFKPEFNSLEFIGGNLVLREYPHDIEIRNLKEVSGKVSVGMGNLSLPKLEMSGEISARFNTNPLWVLSMPSLIEVRNLFLSDGQYDFNSLEKVSGQLSLKGYSKKTKLGLDSLRHVEGAIDSSSEYDISLPSLEIINSRIRLYSKSLDLPKLKKIVGEANINTTKFNAPSLKEFAGPNTVIRMEGKEPVNLPSLETITGAFNIKYADNVYLPKLEYVIHGSRGAGLYVANTNELDLSSLIDVEGRVIVDFSNLKINKNAIKEVMDDIEDTTGSDNKDRSIKLVDGPKQEVKNQDSRAAFIKAGSKYLIYLSKDSDVSSPLHEVAHLYEEVLTDREKKKILDWAGHKKWTRKTSEAFAKGFEKYLYEGTLDKEAESIFTKFKNFIRGVIENAIEYFKDINEINPEMLSIYNAMVLDVNNVNNLAKETKTETKEETTDTQDSGKKSPILENLLEQVQQKIDAIRSDMKGENVSARDMTHQLNKELESLNKKRDQIIKALTTQEGKGVLDAASFC